MEQDNLGFVRGAIIGGAMGIGVYAVLITIVLLLVGCDLPPLPNLAALEPVPYHDVPYYDTNAIERDRTNLWCRNNPGLAVKTPTCDSADTSDIKAWHHKMGWK